MGMGHRLRCTEVMDGSVVSELSAYLLCRFRRVCLLLAKYDKRRLTLYAIDGHRSLRFRMNSFMRPPVSLEAVLVAEFRGRDAELQAGRTR